MANKSNFKLPATSETREVVRDISGERARLLEVAFSNFMLSVEGNLKTGTDATAKTEQMFVGPVQITESTITQPSGHIDIARKSVEQAFEIPDSEVGGKNA